nr:ribonuclease H-like domain, reverse transcriptase, RNA-dependent DNA polymerase [Tanacetum cinerariifolium]
MLEQILTGNPQHEVVNFLAVKKANNYSYFNYRGRVKRKKDGIFISQDKYVAEILKKFDYMSMKTASTPSETKKPLVKDAKVADVDVHLYRSMIRSLMYLTASRLDIMNKKDERGVVVRNKERIEAITIFLAFASYTGFIVYQMDMKNAFLYGKIDEEVKRKKDGIFISQDKYVAEILKKFDYMSMKTASTPSETKKPLVKDAKVADVDVHLYRSMIRSLMYLTV